MSTMLDFKLSYSLYSVLDLRSNLLLNFHKSFTSPQKLFSIPLVYLPEFKIIDMTLLTVHILVLDR